MAIAPKHVLFAGLGRHVSAAHEVGAKFGTNKTNRQMVLDEVDKAKAAGYECSSMDVNPEQPEESINQIKRMLTDQHQDLFIVGFGLRGNAALTPLFEKVVNACVELSPKTRLGFAPAPNEMYNTIVRVLSEA